MCIEANKHGSQENSIMTNKENSNNKPGLALFTLEYDIYDETYTYITALPYKGKLKGYINRIAEESASFGHLAYDASASSTIYVETSDFDTYAEAKAAAVGAGFVGGEDFVGEANIGEPTVESLKRAINALDDLVISVDHQMEETGSIEEDELRDILDDVSSRTGLWYT